MACAKARVEEVTAQLRAVYARDVLLVGAIAINFEDLGMILLLEHPAEDHRLRFATDERVLPLPPCADSHLSIKTRCGSRG